MRAERIGRYFADSKVIEGGDETSEDQSHQRQGCTCGYATAECNCIQYPVYGIGVGEDSLWRYPREQLISVREITYNKIRKTSLGFNVTAIELAVI